MPPATVSRPKTAKPANDKAVRAAADLMKHASDPTRLRIILALADGEQHVGALLDLTAHSQANVSHHLAGLRLSGLVEPRREGKRVYYSMTEKGQALASVAKGLL